MARWWCGTRRSWQRWRGRPGSRENGCFAETLETTRRFEVVSLSSGKGCEILTDAECLLPYPSSHFLKPADTPTGWRLELPDAGVPPTFGRPGSAEAFRSLDGFSPGVHPLLYFPGGVDLAASFAPQLDPLTRSFDGRSLEDDSPSVLIDAKTGERILHFVELDDLEKVRRVPGYHDEPLKGDRAGQRSIRLSRSDRAIYEIKKDTARFVSVEEVHKHDY